MADFISMDTAAHTAKFPNEKIRIYREIVAKAQKDPEFRKTIDWDRFNNSSRSLSHLLESKNQTTANNDELISDTSQNHISKLRIAILGYKSDLMGTWDPFDTEKGLPGSEECAVYASQELANRGHRVTLYMNPPKDSIWRSPFSNPRWLPEDLWNVNENTETYDLVLMWRRLTVNDGRKRGKIVFFWPHDSPPTLGSNQNFPPFQNFDGICILSEHHRKQFSIWPGFDKIPYTICGNGLVPEQFTKTNSVSSTGTGTAYPMNPYSIGYFSNYARGLIVLMLIWPEIRKEFPEATISICYGRQTWNTMPRLEFQFVIHKILEYKNMGVTEHGKVGHLELAAIMQNTSVWAYPCNQLGLTETFCITAVKCQAAGCIPVTTRIGALNETVHPEAPSSPNIVSMEDVDQYKEKLLATLRRIRDSDPEEIRKERMKYIEYGRQYTWERCINEWLRLFEQIKYKIFE